MNQKLSYSPGITQTTMTTTLRTTTEPKTICLPPGQGGHIMPREKITYKYEQGFEQ